MKKLVASVLSLGLVAAVAIGGAYAQEEKKAEEHATPHYPLKEPAEQEWSFAGPFGHYDKAQLQRGFKVYKEVCSACHSMKMVAFRNLTDLGYSEDQVKTIAAEYQVQDGPNDQGEMFQRPATPSDYFPSPFPNEEAAAYANNGAAPPDFSLIAKAREIERGFPQFLFDIFTMYQESGPDYVHALLTGYQDPPEGTTVPDGAYYNPYFHAAAQLAMPAPLSDGQVTYDDGSPETVDQYAKDVAAFQMWAAEPHLNERKRTGFMVIIFLAVFSTLIFLTKRSIFSRIEH